jgi:heat shock protein HslJ
LASNPGELPQQPLPSGCQTGLARGHCLFGIIGEVSEKEVGVMNARIVSFLLLTAMFLTACNRTTPVPVHPLAETSWQLLSIIERGQEVALHEGVTITLSFRPEQEFIGSTGCNNFEGEYQVQGNTISLSRKTVTQQWCTPETIMQTEEIYLRALRNVQEFQLINDQLELFYDEGQSRLVFIRREG